MADKNNGRVKIEKVGFTVNALHILEQVGQEADAYGIILGVGLIYELIQRIAIRAYELHDAELDRLMNKLHLYEEMKLNEKGANDEQ
jgi:hypothetical protein